MTQRILSITSGENFRDLGGYRTTDGRQLKWRKLIRSGALGNLDNTDQATLAALNLKYDIDFRSPAEVEQLPDHVPSTAKFHHEPVFGTDLTEASKTTADLDQEMMTMPNRGASHMQEVYRQMTHLNSSLVAYRNFFNYLLSTPEDGALLFHCQAGKDRTGFGAYLVLSALGVDFQTIQQDYLLTNTTTIDWVTNKLAELRAAGHSETFVNNYAQLAGVDASYLHAATSAINEQYGSVHHFLTDALQLSEHDLRDLQTLYLTDK